jgi:hypothetical protein
MKEMAPLWEFEGVCLIKKVADCFHSNGREIHEKNRKGRYLLFSI